MKKEILIVLPNDTLGGAEQVLKMITNYFLAKNFVVLHFLTKKKSTSWDDILDHPNLRVVYGDFNSEHVGFVLLPFYLVGSRKYDYIFTSHTLLTGFLGFLRKVSLIRATYFIGRESTSIFKRFSGMKLTLYKLMYRIGYSEIDLLICQTKLMHDNLRENMPYIFKKTKVEIIPNPIILDNINLNEKIPNKYYDYIVAAGRLIHEKGFDILIDSFKIIKKNKPLLNLVILGEGEKRKELEALIKKNKLENSVFMPGFIKNVYPYFKHASLCVVSSRIEGFPNVLLQMMSQNNNVVSTLCAGDIELLEGVEKVKINDVQALYLAMIKVLNKNNEINREKFDKEMKNRTIESFITEIYDKLL